MAARRPNRSMAPATLPCSRCNPASTKVRSGPLGPRGWPPPDGVPRARGRGRGDRRRRGSRPRGRGVARSTWGRRRPVGRAGRGRLATPARTGRAGGPRSTGRSHCAPRTHRRRATAGGHRRAARRHRGARGSRPHRRRAAGARIGSMRGPARAGGGWCPAGRPRGGGSSVRCHRGTPRRPRPRCRWQAGAMPARVGEPGRRRARAGRGRPTRDRSSTSVGGSDAAAGSATGLEELRRTQGRQLWPG